MNKKLAALELICFAVLPFIFWQYGRGFLGDYPAMLLSTVPGFIYTIYRFLMERQLNITGVFIIGSLFISTTINLLSGSAEQMIWNSIWLSLFFTLIHTISLLIRRPFSLYFAVDFAYIQGQPRARSKELFSVKGIFIWFQLAQLLFIARGIAIASLKMWMIRKYGVDSYSQMLIWRQITEWLFGGLIMGVLFYINIPLNRYLQNLNAHNDKSS